MADWRVVAPATVDHKSSGFYVVKAPGFITFLSAESLTFEAIATTVPEPSTWPLSFMGVSLPPSEHQRVPLGLILVRRNWQAKSRLSGRLFVDLARMIGLWPSGDREISCADNWSATPRIAVGPPKSQNIPCSARRRFYDQAFFWLFHLRFETMEHGGDLVVLRTS